MPQNRANVLLLLEDVCTVRSTRPPALCDVRGVHSTYGGQQRYRDMRKFMEILLVNRTIDVRDVNFWNCNNQHRLRHAGLERVGSSRCCSRERFKAAVTNPLTNRDLGSLRL